MNKDLIQLQNANMFQLTNNGDKNDWLIRENMTDKVLAVFPGSLSDEMMFKIIHFARDFELNAFNAGIEFAKQQNLKCFDLRSPFKPLNLLKKA